MKILNNSLRIISLMSVAAILFFTTSCNKEMEQFPDAVVTPVTGPTLDQVLQSNADDSLYYRMIVRGGQLGLINSAANSYTMFVPNNNGMKAFINAASGGLIPMMAPNFIFSAFISNSLPAASAAALVQYNTIPQVIRSESISNTFPNFYYPSTLNPMPAASPFLRLDVYPSTRNGAWLNNIPMTGVDQSASNGVIHHVYTLAVPAQNYLWDRISTASDLTYLKAAIERADSGVVASSSLQGYLSMFGPNFTVFAPTDSAFKVTLTGLIAQGLIAQGYPAQMALAIATQLASTPAVFTNPLLAGTLTPQNVKGIVVYHLLGSRAFTNNFPTTETAYPTLLNSGVPSHPGLKLKAIFGVASPFVAAATVKDVYNNSPAANIIINASPLTPDPNGTSDQQYINGVLHKIDRVLLPQ